MTRTALAALAASISFTFISGNAMAADIAPASPVPVYVKAPFAPPFSWTGFYVGGHVGGDWSNVRVLDDAGDGVPPGPFTYKTFGVFEGGTAGYNLQFKNFVVGIEADLGYVEQLSGAGIAPSSNPIFHQDLTLGDGAYGDITARLGFAIDRTLVYAKGGAAFYDGVARQTTTKPGYVTTGTDTFTGWTAGGGIEHFITEKWSIKAEYQHFRFGTQVGYQTDVGDPGSPIGYRFHNWTDLSADSVKAGVNYHF